MKKLLLALAVGFSFSAKAQSEKKTRLTDSAQVVYHVNANGDKDGLYTVKNLSNDGVWVQGFYQNNQRKKTWSFFSSDYKLALRYNYDAKKLAYFNSDILKEVTVTVLSDDEQVKKNASSPVPLCPVDFFTTLAMQNLPTNFNKGGEVVEITAHIDEDGKATYSVMYAGAKKNRAENFNIPSNKFAIEWIPAMYEGKPVKAEFMVSSTISNASSPYRRARWDN